MHQSKKRLRLVRVAMDAGVARCLGSNLLWLGWCGGSIAADHVCPLLVVGFTKNTCTFGGSIVPTMYVSIECLGYKGCMYDVSIVANHVCGLLGVWFTREECRYVGASWLAMCVSIQCLCGKESM